MLLLCKYFLLVEARLSVRPNQFIIGDLIVQPLLLFAADFYLKIKSLSCRNVKSDINC